MQPVSLPKGISKTPRLTQWKWSDLPRTVGGIGPIS